MMLIGIELEEDLHKKKKDSELAISLVHPSFPLTVKSKNKVPPLPSSQGKLINREVRSADFNKIDYNNNNKKKKRHIIS